MLQRMHRGMLDALAGLAIDPTWVVDDDGSLIAANTVYERWRADLGNDASLQLEQLQRRALDGPFAEDPPLGEVQVARDGTVRTFAIHARATDDGAVAFTAREVETVDHREHALELALVHLFASHDPLPRILDRALALFSSADGWDAVTLWRVDGDAEATWPAAYASHASLVELRERLPAHPWSSGDVLWIDGEPASAFATVVAVPLVDAERSSGVLVLFSHAPHPARETTRRSLAHLGAVFARLLERRQLLDQIARKGAEWLLTVDSIDMPILLVTNDARVTRLNRTAQQLAGRTYDELLGRPLPSFGDGEPWTTLADIATAVQESGIPCTAQIVADETNWDVTASPLSAAANGDDRIVIAMRDTTEIFRLQESVRRGEQLAALGELVAGVAHEVKNPLFGMSVTIDLLEDHLQDHAESLELTGGLRKWIQRLTSLTENLLAYGRTWSTEMVPGDVRDVLLRAIEFSQPRAAEAQVVIEPNLSSATVLMDATRLQLVFENLLANAIQHSPAEGRVFLDAVLDGETMDITVRDQGPGLAPGEASRVFQPFYTRRRGGTGLGLSIVQRISDEHGGTVTASNFSQGGAVLRVRLPIYRTGN